MLRRLCFAWLCFTTMEIMIQWKPHLLLLYTSKAQVKETFNAFIGLVCTVTAAFASTTACSQPIVLSAPTRHSQCMEAHMPPPRHRTLGQNHEKHSIAILGPFVLKKGPNRGIKCQFDILEKKSKGGGGLLCRNFFHL